MRTPATVPQQLDQVNVQLRLLMVHQLLDHDQVPTCMTLATGGSSAAGS